MAGFDADSPRFDPYEKFKFRLRMDGHIVAGFSKVSVLQSEVAVADFRAGGDDDVLRKLPGATSHEPITLQRGLTHDRAFMIFANNVTRNAASSPQDFLQDISIEVYGEEGLLTLVYTVVRCWVSAFQAAPDLNVDTSAVAIETLQLENEGWRIDICPTRSSDPTLIERGT